MTPKLRLGARALVLSAALSACADAGPVAPPVEAPAAPPLAALDCTARVASATVSCRAATPSTGQAPGLIVGGQGEFVFMSGTNAAYTAIDSTFKFDATVQNLIPQPLGTTDGTTPDPAGVRVFFASMPASATGAVSVRNASGTATFLNGDVPYFQYNGNLAHNATSQPVTWRFTVDPTVATFTFTVYVAAQVPHPNGWVDVSPPADTMMADSAQPLTATVRDVVGRPIPGQTITWGSSDPAIGTVTAGGVVTGVSPGTVTISATSGARSGTAAIAVCPNLAVGGVYVADKPGGADICLPGTTGGAEYTVIPMNLSPSTAGGMTLGLTASGIVPAAGAPTPVRLPGPPMSLAGGLRRDDAWETRLREAERRELGPLMARGVARGPAPRRAVTPGVPVVGGLMTLNVETDQPCTAPDNRTGRVVHVGTRIVIVADTTNPSGGLTAADYAAIAETFDTQVWPSITAAYGEPADLDENG
ncbi:Ig-like domain-containing protein, partial [Longimicrobium sp.]|uniref:Ig-like domain-containing protein n=1 Tax=Longimicrobium sp. TaxID=2029185 RepID=UPI002F92EDAC